VRGLTADVHYMIGSVADYSSGVYYGHGTSPESWTRITYLYNPVGADAMGNPGLLATWNTAVLPNGDYVLRVVCNDTVQNQRIVDVPVSIVNEGPDITDLAIVAWPELPEVGPHENYLSPDEDGWEDIAKISFILSNQGYTEVNVCDQDQVLVHKILAGPANPDSNGLVQLEWNGRSDSGALVANDNYTIIVSTGGGAKQASVTVLVDKMPHIQNYQVSPNPFSPDGDSMDDTTTISFNLSEHAYVTVSVETPSETLVKTLAENEQKAPGDLSYLWDGTNNDGALVPEGRYTVRMQGTALTGNIGLPVTLDVFALHISQIQAVTAWADPYREENAKISYTLSQEGILTIKVYNSEEQYMCDIITDAYKASGTHEETWDGRDDLGQILPDGAYYFTIEDSISGEHMVVYDPSETGGANISHNVSMSTTSFDPASNTPCLITYTLPKAALVTIKVRAAYYSGPALRVIQYLVPETAGEHTALWDGRDETGELLEYASYTVGLYAYALPENAILVTGKRPIVSDAGVNPTIFRPFANPYSSLPTSTTITYELSRDSNVTIEIYDSKNELVRVLEENLSRSAGQNTAVWDGKDDTGQLVGDGFYRIEIQAEFENNYSDIATGHIRVHY